MKVFHDIDSLRLWRAEQTQKIVGFVPTMGALHLGHISLVKQAKQSCDLVIASIFINKLQFNSLEDFLKYPSTLDADLELLQNNGCNAVFVPDTNIMYPNGKSGIQLDFGALERIWEGAMRPGHFNGVGVVVSKLFNLIQPHKAFFGQKDLQQVRIIQLMVKELNFLIEIIECDIIRESDGLAMSSRNMRLSASDRYVAGNLFLALQLIEKGIKSGGTVQDSILLAKDYLALMQEIKLEYLAVIKLETMEEIHELGDVKQVAVIIAAWLGGVRLIDNLIFNTTG
jgi:pantoate--beta-alanine ligase